VWAGVLKLSTEVHSLNPATPSPCPSKGHSEVVERALWGRREGTLTPSESCAQRGRAQGAPRINRSSRAGAVRGGRGDRRDNSPSPVGTLHATPRARRPRSGQRVVRMLGRRPVRGRPLGAVVAAAGKPSPPSRREDTLTRECPLDDPRVPSRRPQSALSTGHVGQGRGASARRVGGGAVRGGRGQGRGNADPEGVVDRRLIQVSVRARDRGPDAGEQDRLLPQRVVSRAG